jgi:hypothetical protein
MVVPVIVGAARAAGVANKAAKGAQAVRAGGSSVRGSQVRNAEVRYSERVGGLTTNARIQARAQGGRKSMRDRVADEFLETAEDAGNRRDQVADARVEQEARRVFGEAGLDYENEDIKALLKEEAPEEPHFPFFIFFLAIIKDILDALDLTGVGAILTTIFSIILGAVLLIWMWRKMRGPVWKKQHAQKMAKRLLAVVGLEFIPFLKIIPINTIWILMNHYEETHLAQALGGALSRLPAQLRRRVQ